MASIPALLGGLIAVIKVFGRGGIKTLVGAWMLMRRFNLHMLAFFMIFVLPELLGSYAFLRGEGINWYFAVVSAIGVEAGGSGFTAYNNFVAIASGDVGISAPILIFGAIASLTTLFWYIYIWLRFVNFMGGLPPVAWISIGGIIFALMVMITLMVDQYMLSGETLRVSGMTYFLENPDQSLDPIYQLMGEHSGESPYIDENQTTNQTNMTGD